MIPGNESREIVAREDRTRDDQDDAEQRNGAENVPEPAPDEQTEKAPSELPDEDRATEQNLERLRKLGRG
jgi:hypothetical protein